MSANFTLDARFDSPGLAQRLEVCEFESHPRLNSVVSQISQNIEISLFISHSKILCDRETIYLTL